MKYLSCVSLVQKKGKAAVELRKKDFLRAMTFNKSHEEEMKRICHIDVYHAKAPSNFFIIGNCFIFENIQLGIQVIIFKSFQLLDSDLGVT